MPSKNALILMVTAVVVAVVIAMSLYSQAHSGGHAHPSPQTTQLAAGPSHSPAAPSPSAIPKTNPATACSTANLAASVASSPQGGAAGTSYHQIVLTNQSSHDCTISGFPGVSLVDAAGNQLGQPAVRNNAVAVQTIVLKPNASVATDVGFPNPGNFQPGACSASSASIKIYPPNQTAALLVPLTAQYCPGFSVLALTSR